jgi:thymidylate kinase
MQIISISGLDGSGKSTQINTLQENLESRGYKVFYFHAITFSVANILNTGKKRLSNGKTKDVSRASWIAICMRKIALMIDLMRFRSLITRLSHKKYDYVLSDRYFFDMVVNIAYLSHKKYKPFFQNMMIIPDYAFYLSVDPYKIMQRNTKPAQGVSYLINKNNFYRTYTDLFHFTVVDGDRDQSVIATQILETILHKSN